MIGKHIRNIRYSLGLEMGLYPAREAGDLIIMYHNVFPHSLPGLNVRNIGQREFSEELQYLKKRFSVVPLAELFETKARTRRVAITFDDGLLNNMKYAQRTLEQFRLPATFFACTAYLRGRSILWPDHLAMTGFRTGKPIEWEGETYLHRRGNRYISKAGKKLTHVLMKASYADIERFMDSCEEQTGYKPTDDTRHEYRWRVMRAEELRIMSESALVEIGSHGVTHANFRHLSDDEARAELADSKSYIESAIGRPVASIAWPYGLYTRRSLDLAEQCGYTRQLAVDYQHDEDNADQRIRSRVGLYNDRSWVEQMHQVHTAFVEEN
ncbi:MAG: polysaccharide deacetylase family protein [Flavobacteriales bacterium]